MKVPFFEVRRTEEETDTLCYAANSVVESGHYILGPEVEAFEAECAEFLGVKHAIGVSSGTDALVASLMALGIGPGDEVIVPTFTFVATASAVTRVGARPVFVDVRDDTLTIDEFAAELAITERTKATIPVHLFGQTAVEYLDDAPILCVTDAAQAFGSFSGTLGVMDCYSFFPTKNLGGFGDGGMVTTDDAGLALRLRAIRNHGSHVRYRHEVIGGNFRLDALQAALLRVALRSLPAALKARQKNASAYRSRLVSSAALELPPSSPTVNQFVVRVREGRRDALRTFLTSRGIGTEIYYPKPLHLQPCFAPVSGSFPVAELAAREVLALPIFPGLREDEIAYVCDAVCEFFARCYA